MGLPIILKRHCDSNLVFDNGEVEMCVQFIYILKLSRAINYILTDHGIPVKKILDLVGQEDK